MADRAESSNRGRGEPRRSANIYTNTTRKKIFLWFFDEGNTAVEICQAQRGSVGPQRSCIYEMIREFKACGSWKKCDYRRHLLGPLNASSRRGQSEELMRRQTRADAMPPGHVEAIRELLEEEPELYLDELESLLLRRGIAERVESIARACYRTVQDGGLGYSRKVLERKALQRDFEERARFLRKVRGGLIKYWHVVCIDESHKSRDECRRRKGRARRGAPINISTLFQDGQSYTILAACNVDGFIFESCETTSEIQTSETFVRWVEMKLRPILGRFSHGEANSVVLFDNDHKHWHPEVRRIIEEEGAVMLPTPRYSPDLNPIERGFGWVKARLKRTFCRPESNVRAVIDSALQDLPAKAMAGFFRSCFWLGARSTAERLASKAAARAATAAVVAARRPALLTLVVVKALLVRRRLNR